MVMICEKNSCHNFIACTFILLKLMKLLTTLITILSPHIGKQKNCIVLVIITSNRVEKHTLNFFA